MLSKSQARRGNALVSCGRWLYGLGGWNVENYLSVERLSQIRGTWEKSESMLKPRHWFAAVNCAHVRYAIGGKDERLQAQQQNGWKLRMLMIRSGCL